MSVKLAGGEAYIKAMLMTEWQTSSELTKVVGGEGYIIHTSLQGDESWEKTGAEIILLHILLFPFHNNLF